MMKIYGKCCLLLNVSNATSKSMKVRARVICISFTLHKSWPQQRSKQHFTSEMIIFFTSIFTLFIQSRCCSDLISTAVIQFKTLAGCHEKRPKYPGQVVKKGSG